MTEFEFQIVKSVGFVLAFGLAAGLQWARPHTTSTGSWRANATLWIVDAGLMGVVCGACACVVSRWAGAHAQEQHRGEAASQTHPLMVGAAPGPCISACIGARVARRPRRSSTAYCSTASTRASTDCRRISRRF